MNKVAVNLTFAAIKMIIKANTIGKVSKSIVKAVTIGTRKYSMSWIKKRMLKTIIELLGNKLFRLGTANNGINALKYYWSGKNDDIWEDETFKRLFPKSEKINIQIIYIMALIMFGCSMILEVKYNGKIPTVFIAMVLEDWILVLILIWNHRDNKQNIKYALIYGIISTIILIILYKLGKFDFEDILKD